METTIDSERTHLLSHDAIKTNGVRQIPGVLPIAFTAAFAIAATSATTIYAYADIICEDASHCKDGEQRRYSGTIAFATSMANVFGITTIGVLGKWTKSHPKLGLCFWLASRGIGIIVLGIGVFSRSVFIAIAGQVFEGLATDNLLHYALGTIYIGSNDPDQFSRLMGISLGLYMIGMSLGPMLITLLHNFIFSFFVAATLLGLSLAYLAILVPKYPPDLDSDRENSYAITTEGSSVENASLLNPIYHLRREPTVLFPGTALLLYNCAQAYLFPCIMIYATTKFGFTSTENGYLVSIAASTSSIYLFLVLFAGPMVLKPRTIKVTNCEDHDSPACSGHDNGSRTKTRRGYRFTVNGFFALLSMSVLLFVLPCFTVVPTGGSIYGLVALIALGLAAPSFIKSFGVVEANDRVSSLASLAVLESIGGLLSPVVLGTSQTLMGQGSIFLISAFFVGAAILCLIGGMLI